MAGSKYLRYRGFPLVRDGNQIYYGNMSDDVVIMLQIMSTKKVGDLEVADRVKVWLMLTQTEGVDAGDIMKKSCERNGLYEALDVGYIWLTREQAAG